MADLSAPILYFSYGSNMEPGPMGIRCPGATVVGTAVLNDWKFRINQRGYATLVPYPGGIVHGVLWKITGPDERRLDDYEGLDERLYFKRHLTVSKAGRGPIRAMVYLATHDLPGTPLPGYLEPIREAAAHWGFPDSYLAELTSWLRPVLPG